MTCVAVKMNSYNIIVYIRTRRLVSRYQHWNEENSDEFGVAMVSMLKENNDDDKQIAIFYVYEHVCHFKTMCS